MFYAGLVSNIWIRKAKRGHMNEMRRFGKISDQNTSNLREHGNEQVE